MMMINMISHLHTMIHDDENFIERETEPKRDRLRSVYTHTRHTHYGVAIVTRALAPAGELLCLACAGARARAPKICPLLPRGICPCERERMSKRDDEVYEGRNAERERVGEREREGKGASSGVTECEKASDRASE